VGLRAIQSAFATDVQANEVIVRTFQADNGQYCREFLDVRRVTGSAQDHRSIACRSADGVWKVRVRYLPENGGV
jgi:surface antigen